MKLFSRIFSMLVIASVFSVLFCAPTFAEDSLSIAIDGAPTIEATPNNLSTASVDVFITSTANGGYRLGISDSDDNNTLISNTGDSISPLAGPVTSDSFTTNSWGVKVGDNYLPVPKFSGGVLDLATTSTAATNNKHTVTFGAKTDGTTISGAYSTEIVFTAVTSPNPVAVKKATLQTGPEVNAIWKSLATGNTVAYSAADNNITSIQEHTGTFTDDLLSSATNIATNDSEYPVYTWYDNGVIYYYTEADEVFFNEDSSYMFSRLVKLTDIGFNFGLETDIDPDKDGFITSTPDTVYITSNVTNMSSMFYFHNFLDSPSLTTLDLSKMDTSSVTDMSQMFMYATSLTNLDVSSWDTSNVYYAYRMFNGASSLTTLDVSKWNTGSIHMADGMFNGASSLTTLDVSKWNTGRIATMRDMFRDASALTTLDVSNWNTSSATDMNGMFYNTSSLTTLDVSKWDVHNATDMGNIFEGASSLTELDVSKWDVHNVTDMDHMFYGASSLTTLDVSKWNIHNVTDMGWMFYNASALTTLDVSNWNTGKVIDMEKTFSGASSLSTLDVSKWDTSKVVIMNGMFYNTSSLTTLDVSKWDTGSVDDMLSMFDKANSLTVLDLSSWDTSRVKYMSYMFRDTTALTTIYASEMFNTDSVESSVNMFTGAVNLVGGNGTVYSSNHVDKGYARIDTSGAPGYFTEKIVAPIRKAKLDTGQHVNAAWKTLSSGSSTSYISTDTNITSIQKFTGVFTDSVQTSATNIATNDSEYPVYTWYDNGVIYYYTEADEVFLNYSSSHMFDRLTHLTSIDFNFGLESDIDPDGDGLDAITQEPVYITSGTADMEWMFYGDSALTTLDLSKWDTSGVYWINKMFYGASALTTIYTSDLFNTSSISSSRSEDMFTGATSLVGGNGTRYNANYTDKVYARIDAPGTPGYFTAKTN